MLESLRKIVADLHAELPLNNLVTWTSGNISGRDPVSGYIVIKPSGLRFSELGPENMVVVDAEGNVLEGHYKPSSDTATHAYIYRHLPEVGGIVHTHSPYATAWAALGKDIPCVLTAMGDEFGGVIPCGNFALIGGEEIGQEIVRVLCEGPNPHSPAVIMQNHGVFTIGPTPMAAVKAAVMCEDVARTVFLAYQLGEPIPISKENIARLHQRYSTVYGQSKDT
ncbi:MAG: L-ribulose-5-phosphate 4-epimerase [Anaerolineae bacterium]|nr:L-ribulose-5-phosphate 4-epimerase [Anaerolineae bacterium]